MASFFRFATAIAPILNGGAPADPATTVVPQSAFLARSSPDAPPSTLVLAAAPPSTLPSGGPVVLAGAPAPPGIQPTGSVLQVTTANGDSFLGAAVSLIFGGAVQPADGATFRRSFTANLALSAAVGGVFFARLTDTDVVRTRGPEPATVVGDPGRGMFSGAEPKKLEELGWSTEAAARNEPAGRIDVYVEGDCVVLGKNRV